MFSCVLGIFFMCRLQLYPPDALLRFSTKSQLELVWGLEYIRNQHVLKHLKSPDL